MNLCKMSPLLPLIISQHGAQHQIAPTAKKWDDTTKCTDRLIIRQAKQESESEFNESGSED